MDIQGPKSTKYQLSCCALANLSAGNDTSIEELQWQVDKMKQEAKEKWECSNRRSGERAVFTICTMPYEQPLKNKLKKLGFKRIFVFNRRNGYPNGQLHMMALKW